MKPLLAAVLVLGCAALASAGPAEHPLKKAKVGDWVEYKKTGGPMGKSSVKLTVTDVEDKEVTVEVVETSEDGKQLKKRNLVIDVNKQYNPVTYFYPKVKVGKAKAEKIKVGGKDRACVRTELTVLADVKGYDFTATVWTSKEVALDGVVKLETKNNSLGNVTMTLTGTGRKR